MDLRDDPILWPALVALVGGLGLVIGSFLNVLIWRVPRGESVVRPRSRCPRCGHQLSALENVPVLAWLALRGRCRACRAPISVRYPLIELLTGGLFAGTAAWLGPVAALPAFLFLAAVAVALGAIDLDVRRLPNQILLPSLVVAPVLLAVAGLVEGEGAALARAAIGAGAMFAFYFLLAVVYPAGMGWGDVKLAPLLGMFLGWVGWGALVVGSFAAFVLGGVFSLCLMLAGRAGRKTGIPFGPWMLLGAAIGLVSGEALWSAYLGLIV